ncbi:MAG: TolC family protein [Candidatus Aminicenantes bacterium]|nr:TolC family protein [Candidatus Aminicenantes bacterium]
MKKSALLCFLFLLPAILSAQENPLRLDDLLNRALERNPKIKSVGLEAKASSFRIPQQKTLPDPMIGLTLKNMGFPGFTVGQEVMSGIGLSFSQAIPFPGKLRLKGEIAEKAFARKEEVRNATVLSVLKEVKTLYFELYSLQKSLIILGEQKALLRKAAELTETKYAVGNGVQSDVLKARVEIFRMDEMIIPMAEMIKSLSARLNLLLDSPPDTPLGVPQDQYVDHLPVSLEDIKAAAQKSSPMLKEASLMVEEDGKMVDLAKKELSPNFVIAGGWEYKGRLPSMYEIMLGVEVPLYQKTKQSKMLEESLALHQSSKSGLASAKNDVAAMITEEYLKAKSAETLIQLYKEKIIPQASLTVESSLANYQVNKTDFLALLADINTYFSYQLAYYKELAGLWSSIAALEEYSAKEIVKWGGPHEDKN